MLTDKAGVVVGLIERAGRDGAVLVGTIKELRGTRHQKDLAKAAGISQPYLSELETGAKPLTPGLAEKLAPVLGVTAGEPRPQRATARA